MFFINNIMKYPFWLPSLKALLQTIKILLLIGIIGKLNEFLFEKSLKSLKFIFNISPSFFDFVIGSIVLLLIIFSVFLFVNIYCFLWDEYNLKWWWLGSKESWLEFLFVIVNIIISMLTTLAIFAGLDFCDVNLETCQSKMTYLALIFMFYIYHFRFKITDFFNKKKENKP